MLVNDSKENKVILTGLFVAILGPILNSWMVGLSFPDSISSFVNMFDELYALMLFAYTFATRGFQRQRILSWLLIGLFIIGFLSGQNSVFILKVNLLGAFSIIKNFLIFLCLCQYDFEWEDFDEFCRYFVKFLPFVCISYIFDFFSAGFRLSIGYFSTDRLGFRQLAGFFPKYTMATLFGLFYYIYYKYYTASDKIEKGISYFGAFMILITVKIKDIFGLIVVFISSLVEKIKPVYFFLLAFLLTALMDVYEILMPDHYNRYFGDEADTAARTIMTNTSFHIARDYFPLGVGWGKFGSATSIQFESEIYRNYGIGDIWGLNYDSNATFMQDNQFPMFLGETGILGFVLFLIILYVSFKPFVLGFMKDTSDRRFIFPSLLFIYFLINVMGKPVFVAVPHSFVLWGVAGIFYSFVSDDSEEVIEFES